MANTTRNVKFKEYKEFEFNRKYIPGAPVEFYEFKPKKDKAEAVETGKYIYFFRVCADGSIIDQEIKVESDKSYQLVVKEGNTEVNNYFALSRIKLSDTRIKILKEQLKTRRNNRLQVIPIAREYTQLTFTPSECENADRTGTITTVYLTDYFGYVVDKLNANFDNAVDEYSTWLKRDNEIPIPNVSMTNISNFDLKLLNDATFHLCHLGKQSKSISTFDMHLAYLIMIGGFTAVAGPAVVAATYKDFIEVCKNYSFHRAKLKKLDKSKKSEMPKEVPYKGGYWTEADYWRKKYQEKESELILKFIQLSKPLVTWIDTQQFAAVQMDYEFGSDEQRREHEDAFGKIISGLASTPIGKTYLTNLYNRAKNAVITMKQEMLLTKNKSIQDIVKKELSNISESDRAELVKFAYYMQYQEDWFSTRIIVVRDLNEGFGAILGELSFLISHETEPITEILNMPKDYLYGVSFKVSANHLLTKHALFYVEGWKNVLTKTAMENLQKDLDELKRIEESKLSEKIKKARKDRIKKRTDIELDPDKSYHIVFSKEVIDKEPRVVAKIEQVETKQKPNWADKLKDSNAYTNFCGVVEALNLISTVNSIFKAVDDKDNHAFYMNSLLALSSIASIFEIYLKKEAFKKVAGIAANAIEGIVNGFEAAHNFMEEDNDVGAVYVVSCVSNAASIAMILSGAATTGPVGAAIAVGLAVVNYFLSRLAVYLDDDDYEDWLEHCFWGIEYPETNTKLLTDWSVKPFVEWTDNLNVQLEAYKQIINNYKLEVSAYGNVPTIPYSAACMLDIRLNPTVWYDFSAIFIDIKIDGKEFAKDLYITSKNAVIRKSGDYVSNINFSIIDADGSGLYDENLPRFQMALGKSDEWLSKTKNNKLDDFASTIDKNEIDQYSYKAKIEVTIRLDLYSDGKIVCERKVETEMYMDKLFIPSVLVEERYQQYIVAQINSQKQNDNALANSYMNKAELDDMNKLYKKRNCKKCSHKDKCRVHLSRAEVIFSDGIVDCRRLLNADHDDEYKKMSKTDKDKLRIRLLKLNFYVNNLMEYQQELDLIF